MNICWKCLHTRAICVEFETGKGETSNDPQEKYRIDEVNQPSFAFQASFNINLEEVYNITQYFSSNFDWMSMIAMILQQYGRIIWLVKRENPNFNGYPMASRMAIHRLKLTTGWCIGKDCHPPSEIPPLKDSSHWNGFYKSESGISQ